MSATSLGPRFKIVHLLYATAVCGASVALVGPSGMVLSLLVLAMWTSVFRASPSTRAMLGVTFAVFALMGFCLALQPVVPAAREAARQMHCMGRFKHLALAIHNHADVHGGLPPAIVVDANDRPMHSWRTSVLPYLEEQKIHRLYDFDEPWDSAHNTALRSKISHNMLCCPSVAPTDQPIGNINVAAIVGEQAAFSRTGHRTFDQFVAGPEHTVMLMELNPPGIPYTQPVDLTPAEAMELLTSKEEVWCAPHVSKGFFYDEDPTRLVAMADGSVHRLVGIFDRAQALALVRVDQRPRGKWTMKGSRLRRLNVGNCVRLAVFVVLILLPLPSAWRRAAASPAPPSADISKI